MWHLYTKSLPTNWNLHKKKILENPTCPLCLNEAETTTHMIWNCRAVGDVWTDSCSETHKWPSSMEDIKLLWGSLCKEHMYEGEITLGALIMKHIWLRRNELVFRNKFQSPQRVLLSFNWAQRFLSSPWGTVGYSNGASIFGSLASPISETFYTQLECSC